MVCWFPSCSVFPFFSLSLSLVCRAEKTETKGQPGPPVDSAAGDYLQASKKRLASALENEDEDKRHARLQRNRESAMLSRQRKKMHQQQLEQQLNEALERISQYEHTISALAAENSSLKRQVELFVHNQCNKDGNKDCKAAATMDHMKLPGNNHSPRRGAWRCRNPPSCSESLFPVLVLLRQQWMPSSPVPTQRPPCPHPTPTPLLDRGCTFRPCPLCTTQSTFKCPCPPCPPALLAARSSQPSRPA